MARKKTTVYLDEEVLRAARIFAARSGRRHSEVIESAVRAYIGFDVFDGVAQRDELDPDEALALAVEAVHETRGR